MSKYAIDICRFLREEGAAVLVSAYYSGNSFLVHFPVLGCAKFPAGKVKHNMY